MNLEFLGLFLTFAGYIIGLGAVTVIDIHGALGRKSEYWNEATIRTHKVTKPLIWIGLILLIGGGIITYQNSAFLFFQMMLWILLIVNGSFLSFVISPELLKREKEGRARELLPASIQKKIIMSFVVSIVGWWGSVAMLVFFLQSRM